MGIGNQEILFIHHTFLRKKISDRITWPGLDRVIASVVCIHLHIFPGQQLLFALHAGKYQLKNIMCKQLKLWVKSKSNPKLGFFFEKYVSTQFSFQNTKYRTRLYHSIVRTCKTFMKDFPIHTS